MIGTQRLLLTQPSRGVTTNNNQRAQGKGSHGILFQGWMVVVSSTLTLGIVLALSSFLEAALALTDTHRLGDRGSSVSRLQEQLRYAGFFGRPTGAFGGETEAAVRAFQQSRGLYPKGAVDLSTKEALQAATSWSILANLQTGDTGPSVSDLQAQLRDLGFYRGSINDRFDLATADALQRFQRSRGLDPNGQVDLVTYEQLKSRSDRPPASAIAPAFPPGGNSSTSNLPPRGGAAIAQIPTLRLGSQGQAVNIVQSRLYALRLYPYAASGYFDAATRDAVIRFQRSRRLAADGVVGPQTWQALCGNAVRPFNPIVPFGPGPVQPVPTLRRGSRGPLVLDLKRRLCSLSFCPYPLNDNFDRVTEDAVRSFQRWRGLPDDGVVGPATAEALRRSSRPPYAINR